MSSTAQAVPFQGLTIGISATDSPASYATVANIMDWNFPGKSTTVDVTNAAQTWKQELPTLLDAGKVTFKIFWVMTNTSHKNTASGLRYLWTNLLHRYFQIQYNDGNSSADILPAYVTQFSVTGKVAGVMEATLELSIGGGTPTLV